MKNKYVLNLHTKLLDNIYMRIKGSLLFSLTVLFFLLSSCLKDSQEVKSPDGRIKVTVSASSLSDLNYTVDVSGKEFIIPSQLGIVTTEPILGENVIVSYSDIEEYSEQWAQPWGENKKVINHYNERSIIFRDDSDRSFTVRFRVFDDGLAFRYEWNAGEEVDTVVVKDELTQFGFAVDGISWSIAANADTYELPFRKQTLSDVENVNTPFTIKTDNGKYASIHEAALYDYPEMTLSRDHKGYLKAELSPLPDGIKAYVSSEFSTPWRTIQISDDAVGLINSSLILNLNEPSKITDTSWIKPQKYIGIWWGMHLGLQTWIQGPRHGATTRNAKKYIDFASENNIQGVLFEGWNKGWENWGSSENFDYITHYPDFDLPAIAKYAEEKGIELWIHNETGGNLPEYEAVLDSALNYYQSLGIHTLKTGYAGNIPNGGSHHSQSTVRHYQKVVEACAKYQIMLDAHEPIKETGIRRTWPNMMTREGARGMEWNAWSEGNDSEYLCILPYTRLLSGPMDYTPGIFDIDFSSAKADKGRLEWNGPNEDCCIKTTLSRQIANWVIIYSPLQMAADLIENYEGHPAFNFFRIFDADCDWSKALDGEIGEYIVVVRRAKDSFFLGAGTNHDKRTIEIPLTFLEKGVEYLATIYADDIDSDNPEDYIIEEKNVNSTNSISITMNANGGQAITFQPIMK